MVQIDEIFGNRNVMKILAYFLEKPSSEISQVELISKLKIAKATAVKWLRYLVKVDVLSYKKVGVTNLYRMNNENNVVKQTKILKIILDLVPLKKIEDSEVYLYGSAARGEYDENSDIDLLFLGNVKRQDIIEIVDKISKKINKSISVNIFKSLEWAMMAKKDPPFYERVEKDKIRIA